MSVKQILEENKMVAARIADITKFHAQNIEDWEEIVVEAEQELLEMLLAAANKGEFGGIGSSECNGVLTALAVRVDFLRNFVEMANFSPQDED